MTEDEKPIVTVYGGHYHGPIVAGTPGGAAASGAGGPGTNAAPSPPLQQAIDRLKTAERDSPWTDQDLADRDTLIAQFGVINPIKWPRHLAGMTIAHNEHKTSYMPVEQWADVNSLSWVNMEERAKAIAEDSIWTIHWYPDTPIGFYSVSASTFEAVLSFAISETEAPNDKKPPSRS